MDMLNSTSLMIPNKSISTSGNEIVIYQPNEILRIEVRLENESVWLSQQRIAELFGVQKAAISKHLKNIFASGELIEQLVVSKMETTTSHGAQAGKTQTHTVNCYNLDAIIAVGYRVNSIRATHFRIWATAVLREYLLTGYAIHQKIINLEDKVERRLTKQDASISELQKQVDVIVKTNLQPPQGVFYDGQIWDACSLVEKLISKAKRSILLIDNWVDNITLDLLSKKQTNTNVEIVTSKKGNKLSSSEINKFNAQYPKLIVNESAKFHDRFLILDDIELYLFGASLK
ncbi:MAG: virulence RhuM family protein, partial [Victivallales bacterium]|nr:virulence RhuM family protein [Victivallales bacterium]